MSRLFSLHLSVILAMLVCIVWDSTVHSAGFEPWQGSSLIRDPEWQKSFLGSYGFLSGAEPEIKSSELEVLREVIDLMQVNPRAASAMLEKRTDAKSSAALDFILANLYFQNGELEKASRRYESALQKFPDFRRAQKNLGLLKVQSGQFVAGAKYLARAIDLGDRDGRTYGLLGYAYINQENYLAADAAYRQAILQQPEGKDWQLGLARALLAEERYAEVAALFSSYLERHPTDANAWKLQANAFLGLERPLAAAVNLEAVRLLGQADASSLSLLGDIYMTEEITDLAKSAYLEVIESDESGDEFRAAYRAADLLLRSNALLESSQLIASIDGRYLKNLSADDELDLLTLKARLKRARGQADEAAELLERIVARDGTRGDALLELAQYHFDQSNDQRALLLLERAGNLEAFEYQSLIDRAKYRVSLRDFERAARLLRKALNIRHEPRVERFLARVENAKRH